MRFFDAHCDTVVKALDDMSSFRSSPGFHVSLDGLRSAGVCAQVFACCVPELAHPGRARERGVELVEAVKDICTLYSADLVLADAVPRLAAAGLCADRGPDAPVAVIVSLEGADPLEGEVDALKDFSGMGVGLLTLAWDDNPFCGTVFGAGGGLSRKGEDLVQLCEELGVMVDVSHASDQAFADVCGVASRPFVASHSNCRSLCGSERNLTDQMIRALAERGGVMGINLNPGFLSQSSLDRERPARDAMWAAVRSGEKSVEEAFRERSRAVSTIPRPALAAVAAHVLHAMSVGGEDCVGLGGDLDGIESTPIGIEGVADYPRIAELLAAVGLTSAQVDKVCWGNFARVMASTERIDPLTL